MEPWLQWIIIYTGAYLLGSISFAYLFGRMRGIDIRGHGSGNVGATNAGRVLGRPWGIACFVLDALKGFLPPLVAGLWLGLYPAAWSLDPSMAETTATQHLLWIGCGVTAVVGHMHSIFLGFKGGKGVAAGFGCLLAIFPHLTIPAVGALAIWGITVLMFRLVSLSSMLAASSLPLIYLGLLMFRNLQTPIVDRESNGTATDPAPPTGTGSSAAPAAGPIEPGTGSPAALFDGLETGWPFLVITAVLAGVIVWKHRSNIQRLIDGSEPKIGRSKSTPPAALPS